MRIVQKKTLILEGTNGIGKDVFIQKILDYCPYYKIHYASSDIVNEVKGQEHLLPLMGYTAFETIYTSIRRDPTNYPHIQYRSPLTNLVYNRMYRPDSPWLEEDRMYLERFLAKKYDSSYVFWIMTYSEDYLEKQYRENAGALAERVRGRTKELTYLVNINKMYSFEAGIIASKANAFKFVHTEGTGTLDYFSALDTAIEKAIELFGTYPLVLIDTEYYLNAKDFNPFLCDDNARFVFMSDDMDVCMKVINSSNFRYIPKEKYAILFNNSPDILNYDFFIIYSVSNILAKRLDTKYITDDYSAYFIEKHR